jgi:site-specific DNA-methyltransferase (adenine-specific)
MNEQIQLWRGDCLELMKEIENNSIDTIITDPPYGLKLLRDSM